MLLTALLNSHPSLLGLCVTGLLCTCLYYNSAHFMMIISTTIFLLHCGLLEVRNSILGVLLCLVSSKVAGPELLLAKCLWVLFELPCHQSSFHYKLLESWSKLPFSETWKWYNAFWEWFIENHVFHTVGKDTMIRKISNFPSGTCLLNINQTINISWFSTSYASKTGQPLILEVAN